MAEFEYNNAKIISVNHNSFELNWDYHLRVSYKKEIDSLSKSKSAKELAVKLRDLKTKYQKNIQYTQGLQKQHHNQATKSKSYSLGDKARLNSKLIKTEQNRNLKANFFKAFPVLYQVESQA